MEVETAHSGGFGERIEVRHLVGLFDQTARLRHRNGASLRERRFVWPAPLAWPETRLFGIFPTHMKIDILAPRQTRSAAGPAIDTRRQHGIAEHSFRAPVAVNDGGPAIVVVGK
jgi:hypothetical protein